MTWQLLIATLTGEPMPPVPAIPGRLIQAADEPLQLTDAERDELLDGPETDAHVGLLLGLSRARVGQMRHERQAAAQTLTTTTDPERQTP